VDCWELRTFEGGEALNMRWQLFPAAVCGRDRLAARILPIASSTSRSLGYLAMLSCAGQAQKSAIAPPGRRIRWISANARSASKWWNAVSNHNRVGLAVAEWDRFGRAVDGSHGRQPSPDHRAHVPRRLDSDDPDVGVGTALIAALCRQPGRQRANRRPSHGGPPARRRPPVRNRDGGHRSPRRLPA
jgi:hypothetical protein